MASRLEDPRLEGRNRWTARLLLAWIGLLAAASVAVVWVRN
jgi:hypothetical protein